MNLASSIHQHSRLGLLLTVILLIGCPFVGVADTAALFIGNNEYKHVVPLLNPINDVRGISKKFKSAGISHEVLVNASRSDMEDALDNLRLTAANAAVVMVYFAGHGIEVDGKNYLIPTGAELASESRLPDETISLDAVLKRLGECGTSSRFLVLDCCRNNPFASEKWLKGYTGGLAPIEKSALPPDTVVIYSGAPGEAVPDGTGENSPFAAGVIANCVPGKSALNIFTTVAGSIKDGQKPWMRFNGELASLAPLVVTPLLGKPLPMGEVNLSLMLRIFETSGREIEEHFQQDKMQNSPAHMRWHVGKMRQRVVDIAKVYLPAGYYGPAGVEAYLNAEIALMLKAQTEETVRNRALEVEGLAINTFEGNMVELIVKRALGKEAGAAWMQEHDFDY